MYFDFEAFTNYFPCVSGNFMATELAENKATLSFCQFNSSSLMIIAILFSNSIFDYFSLSSI
jgi:hypothetical protein